MAARSRSFAIEDCLGRGGFGEVYRARMTQPGGLTTTVAVKVLLPGLAGGSQPVDRLRDEGRLLAALDHPAILKVVDVVELEGRVALIAEYVPGQDLHRCCAEPGPMGTRALVQAIGEVASALHAAWSAPSPETGEPLHLLHRDVKPSNIRVGRHGEVKLLDFGIARTDAMRRDAHTATHAIVGSLPYMAPERFAGPAPGPAADVYGLGCCLYQGVVGEVPFPGLDTPQAFGLAFDRDRFAARLHESLDRLHPDAVRRLVADCLAHDPAARPTARELTERCEALAGLLRGPTLKAWARARSWPADRPVEGPLAGRTLTDHPPTADAPPPTPRRPWAPWLAATGGVAFLGLSASGLTLALTGAWYLSLPGEPAATPPSPEPDLAAAPTPAPPPTAPRPAAPRPQVAPVEPVEAPPATGSVVITGTEPVELRSAHGASPPGVVTAGTWDVFADFGSGLQLAGSVEVPAGAVVTVRCNPLLASCAAEPP